MREKSKMPCGGVLGHDMLVQILGRVLSGGNCGVPSGIHKAPALGSGGWRARRGKQDGLVTLDFRKLDDRLRHRRVVRDRWELIVRSWRVHLLLLDFPVRDLGVERTRRAATRRHLRRARPHAGDAGECGRVLRSGERTREREREREKRNKFVVEIR